MRRTLPAPPPAERVLVVRLGALGDVVRTRFAFAGVRALWPHARIEWLVEDRAAAGLTGLAGLDDTLVIPRRDLALAHPTRLLRGLRRTVGELRARRFDVALDFHGLAKSAALLFAARIPVRVGFAAPVSREGSARLLTHRAELTRRWCSRFERNAALVEYLGGRADGPPPALELGPQDQLDFDVPEVVVHPGTSASTEYKRWPADRFAAVVRALGERGLRSLVTWGPVAGERECAEAVVAAAGPCALLAPPTASVGQLLSLLSRARLFIGGDSGPLHLASLAGLPVVAVFGPTDPVENAPYPGLPHRVVREDVGCNPCREGCPARACLAALAPERVASAALELLAPAPERARG